MKYKNKYTKYETGHNIGDRIYFPETDLWVRISSLENNPDWEKIADYEITVLHNPNREENGQWLYLKSNGMYNHRKEEYYPGIFTFEGLIEKCEFHIHAVKRLEDGVEFKIGDKLVVHGWKYMLIDSFKTINDTVDIVLISTEKHVGNGVNLSEAKHYIEPKVLYTTEDGVDRYEYQSEWWIIKDSENNMWRFIANNNSIVRQGDVENGKIVPIWKVFSTKEAAKKWMEENNPKYIFTTYDGVKIYEKDEYYYVSKIELKHIYHYVSATKGSGNFKDSYAYFSTKALAQKYIDDNTKFLLTEDGVKLKESEMVYWINPKGMYVGFLDVKDIHMLGKMETYKYFSTKEKAEEYILWNKPCLSLNDIVNTKVHGGHGFKMNPDQVIALAKQKQKNG